MLPLSARSCSSNLPAAKGTTMKRILQLIGVLMIALLSAEAVVAAGHRPSEECNRDDEDCLTCLSLPSGCSTWMCPIGHERGVGVKCPGPD